MELEERRRLELERKARIEEEREQEARDERERRRREREEQRAQWLRERESIEGPRRQRKERKRAERAAAKRRRAKRQVALSRGRRPQQAAATAAPTRKAAPRRRAATPRPAPKLRRPPRRGQLAGPTAKVGLAFASVTAAATLLGAAIGLPVPVITSEDNRAASRSGAVELNDSGTPTGLTKGPYFPVVLDGPADYAEGSARFGASRGGRKHEGQDIFAKPGTPLVAVRDGIVIDGGGGKSFYSYGGGNSLVIYSPLDQRSYVYLHMLKPATVQAGETVHAGQIVGQMGCTGSCDGTHLHFEVRNGRVAYGVDTKAIDPLPLLKQWPQASTD
jgi:murein DD-endopeptidase MepM/ murein hydrolase activator NlpD